MSIRNEMVRDVTAEEVAFYEEHGWVKLDALISPTAAAELLAGAKKLRDSIEDSLKSSDNGEPSGDANPLRKTTPEWSARLWASETGGSNFFVRNIRTEPILSFTLSKSLGRVAYRMMNRKAFTDEEVGARILDVSLWCKDSPGAGSGNETGYHQDFPDVALDRNGALNIWLALDEVTPEQGGMRYLDRSHQAGPLGPVISNVLERYPKLPERYAITPPFHYKPGDATLHSHMTVHGSSENSTTKTRWSYICAFIPADAGFIRESQYGYPEPHERFPLTYP